MGDFKEEEALAYKGFQVSLLLYRDFWKLIDPHKFCSTPLDVTKGRATADQTLMLAKDAPPTSAAHVKTYKVRFGTNDLLTSGQNIINASGVYVLVISNCGQFAAASLEGEVVVRNAYGYLPGLEFHKKPFYGWLSLGYLGMASFWAWLSFKWQSELFRIHHCIFGVMVLSTLESITWYAFLVHWNAGGYMNQVAFVFAVFVTTLKSSFSYTLALVASLGWGLTKPHLDGSTICKVIVLALLFVVLDFTRQMVIFFHRSKIIPLTFLYVIIAPLASVCVVMYCWIFSALGKLIESLKESGQTDKLQHFERLSGLLTVAVIAASIVVVIEIADLSNSVSTRWHYQWFLSDGASHCLFFASWQQWLTSGSPMRIANVMPTRSKLVWTTRTTRTIIHPRQRRSVNHKTTTSSRELPRCLTHVLAVYIRAK